MAKYLILEYPSIEQLDASKFSTNGRKSEWYKKLPDMLQAVARFAAYTKQINDYERNCAGESNTAYDSIYGADELIPEMAKPRSAPSILYGMSASFYLTGLGLMSKIYGLEGGSDTYFERYDGYDYSTGYTSFYSSGFFQSASFAYVRYLRRSSNPTTYETCYSATTRLESLGFSMPLYFDLDYALSYATNGTTVEARKDTFYRGETYNTDTASTLSKASYPALYAANRFFATFGDIYAHFQMLKTIVAKVPTTRRGWGGQVSSNYFDIEDACSELGDIKPHYAVQIRQALTKVHHTLWRQGGYDVYGVKTRIGTLIKNELSARSITFASAVMDDKTKDPTEYASMNYRYDPFICAAAGFAPLEYSGEEYGVVVPAVQICRRYLSRRWAVAWDYAETTNPNAYESVNGKANYLKSNIRVWLNSRCSGLSAWKVPTHTYDAYFATGQYPHLATLSSAMLNNIAKTEMCFHPSETTAQIASPWGSYLLSSKHWAFLPNLTQMGVKNELGSRSWTNFQLAVDNGQNYFEDGEEYPSGWLNDGYELYGDYAYFEEAEVTPDIVDNAWELGNRRYQLMPNPYFANYHADEYDGLYIPTSTPGWAKADTRDATIPNRVACFHLNYSNGQNTTSNLGASAPYSYNPTLYAYTLVPFRLEKTDGVLPEVINGPTLSNSDTNYD